MTTDNIDDWATKEDRIRFIAVRKAVEQGFFRECMVPRNVRCGDCSELVRYCPFRVKVQE